MRGRYHIDLSVRLILCTLIGATVTRAADNLGQLALSNVKTGLIAGRLTVSVPPDAKSAALQKGLMAAPESDYEQTRIVIDAGRQRMVLMAYDEFALAGANFEEEVKKVTSRFDQKVTLKPMSLTAPIRAVAYLPVTPTKDRDANLVMGVFAAQPDGSVQRLEWYVNKDAAAQLGAASKLAQSIAQTIAPGKRALDAAGGDRELLVSSTKSIFISIPKGYARPRKMAWISSFAMFVSSPYSERRTQASGFIWAITLPPAIKGPPKTAQASCWGRPCSGINRQPATRASL